jgi:outer membrane protein insertion porin family
MRGAIFADAGSLWDYNGATPALVVVAGNSMSVRASVGGSLIWESPFGPLRFDFAYPVLKEPYDKKQWFRFGAASRF